MKVGYFTLCGLMVASLVGCNSKAPEADFASCKLDAYRAMPDEVGRENSSRLGEFIETCMATKGYRLNPTSFGSCTRQEANCYTR